ncbi:facilitated trehalose transporter Tret1-like [Diachasmimorpha longicaudata]|uniref:facilitated trehalose transporter Tret1-like n=1 Tax=Diachasmimorpha longicaudata TaxID=58733 RepID=UPI0030B8A749
MARVKNTSPEPGKCRQFIATLIINLSSLTFGVTLGWVSPVIPDLQIGKTPVSSSPMTGEQISWLAAVICLGAALMLPFCDGIAERLGRKRTSFVMMIPFFISWILTAFATDYISLLIARIFVGIGGSMCLLVVPIYVAEISGDSVRGQLGSILRFAFNVGLVLGYILGAVLSYKVSALSALTMPVVSAVGLIFIPETPVYLVRKRRITEATSALMWLKSNDRASVDVHLEQLQLQALQHPSTDKSVGFRDLFRDRATFRGFVIALGLLNAPATCGLFVVLTYTATIFQLAGSSLSPNAATIIIGAIQVFGSWLTTLAMDRAGRRTLILVSSAGMVICHCILGSFFLLQRLHYDLSSFSWIPIITLSIFVIVYGLGVGPVPYIIATEIFSPDVSGFANCICQTVMWLVAFPFMKFFPLVIDTLGIYSGFFIFAAFCSCTVIFTHFLVPETRGKNIQTILEGLNARWRS